MTRLPAIAYACPPCRATHLERGTPYEENRLDDRCTAAHRTSAGTWRSCHAPHAVFGRVELADAHLCGPCATAIGLRLEAAR